MWRFISIIGVIITFSAGFVDAQDFIVTRIATGLQNPRGIAVMPDGRLLVVETGTGMPVDDLALHTGRISIFMDDNNDGDYDDADERTPLITQLPSYNGLTVFGTQSDEVGGAGDVVLLDDGRIFYTKDNPQQGYAADGNATDIGIAEATLTGEHVGTLTRSFSTLNGIAYDANTATLYTVESGLNRLLAVSLQGEERIVTEFATLAHGQQAVPSGVAVDPRTGDVLVTLFSGRVPDYFDTVLTFLPGDSKVVRVDPMTGEQQDVITGLTTAVDVAVDEDGNLYVVEFTAGWPTARMPSDFDLYDSEALPDSGGYGRAGGRVLMYPAGGDTPVILASGLDLPTNITYHDEVLYVSTGQGTPGRPVIWPDGSVHTIVGEIVTITNFR
ncbi:MAG: ScyD/ScyE family protein [Chloroflexi bacterium]|nr:MAG: ScyD/ScyE family protein [Chloroflexota bacterium]